MNFPRHRVLLLAGVGLLVLLGAALFLAGPDRAKAAWHSLRSRLPGSSFAVGSPDDPALRASLPVPDPTANLPPSPLNAFLQPGLTPEQQTDVLGNLLLDYWATVRSLPAGTWEEVQAALAGANPKALSIVPPDHPAYGADSFVPAPGAPGIRLHVVSSSGCAFQLIHNGPDREPYTDDDLIRNFPPDLEIP